MKGVRGKAPAFQFYVADWLSDERLRACSVSTRGIWIDVLCFMWKSQDHKLSVTPEGLARMAGATIAEVDCFINENLDHGFCDLEIDYCPGGSVGIEDMQRLHIVSRRFREEEEQRAKWREDWHKRQNKNDKNGDSKKTPKNLHSNSDVSSTSTSTSDLEKNLPSGGKKEAGSKKKKRRKQIPEPFIVTNRMREWFAEKGFVFIDLEVETEKFINHWTAKGEVRADWIATWRNWMINGEGFAKRDQGGDDSWKG